MTERRGIEVRWGLREDEAHVAELLELNGKPRPLAFEERFIVAVAEPEGELLAALSYRTASKRLLLGFFIADPWAEEGSLAQGLCPARLRSCTVLPGFSWVKSDVGSGETSRPPRTLWVV